jgi:hypothetical protein
MLPQLWPKTGFVPKSLQLVLFQLKYYPLLLLELMQDNGANSSNIAPFIGALTSVCYKTYTA